MAAPKAKSKFEREEHLARVMKLRLQGWTHQRIANATGVSRQVITRDIKIIEQRWKDSSLVDMATIKGRVAQEIENLKAEFWGGWERSAVSSETKQVKEGPRGTEKSVRQESAPGDPRFLEGVRHCIEDEIELYGLNKLDEELGDAAQAFAAKIRADLRTAEAMTLGDDATLDEDS